MVYLIDPKEVYGSKECIGVVYPLYGVPPEPCYQVCTVLCALLRCPILG